MNKSIREVVGDLSVVTTIMALTLLGMSAGWAQQKAGDLKQRLVGTWLVVSQYVDQEGKKVEPFGSNPKGVFMFDRSGHLSIIIMRSGLPKIASNNRLKATPEENKAIAEGIVAYYGTYTVNEKDGSLSVKVDGSSYPNWGGEIQKRMITIKGDEMKLVNPTAAIGGGSVHVVLKRAK